MAKIYAPNKEYTGVSASVYFVNGVGETDKQNLIEWFREKGYGVGMTEAEEETEEIQETEEPNKKSNKSKK